MSRNKLVKGAIKAKDWFFEITATPLKRGKRFLTDDRPDEATFRNWFESIPFKAEVTDKAYEDVSGTPLSEKQGLTALATDAQAKSFATKSETIARAVQPSQLPQIVAGDGVTVEIDAEESRRNKYIISAEQPENIVPTRGYTELSYDLPSDADIVVIYDGTSFKDSGGLTSLTDAQTRIRSWYNTYRTTNNISGKLIEITIGSGTSNSFNIIDKSNYATEPIDERFPLFPKEYINGNIANTLQTTLPDGTVLPAGPVGTPINTKCVFVIFEDEASLIGADYYTPTSSANADDSATVQYIADYNEFVTNIYNKFEFFKGIVYPAQAAAGENNTGNFHAFLTKTMTNGTLDVDPGLTAVQINAGWASDTMNFMTSSNPFTADGVDNLSNFGWTSTEYEFTGDGSMGTITQAQFNVHIETALAGSSDDHQLVTITHILEMSDGSTLQFEPYTLNVKK